VPPTLLTWVFKLVVFQHYDGKLVFDTSERVAFERALLAELADAVSLPVGNISLEEVGAESPH
jgi:hypothetical protein